MGFIAPLVSGIGSAVSGAIGGLGSALGGLAGPAGIGGLAGGGGLGMFGQVLSMMSGLMKDSPEVSSPAPVNIPDSADTPSTNSNNTPATIITPEQQAQIDDQEKKRRMASKNITNSLDNILTQQSNVGSPSIAKSTLLGGR